MDYDFSSGFVVRGEDTAQDLQEQLEFMGFQPREYRKSIVYWLPKMINNPYKLISFQGETHTAKVCLEIIPPPDSLLRVYMASKPLKAAIDLPEQSLAPFKKKGFTALE